MHIEDKADAVFIPDSPARIKASDYNQIKNEIQECITLAGMTPEKDVIQLPGALKVLTEQSGAEEVAKIEAAGAEQVAQIESQLGPAVQKAEDWASKMDGPVEGEVYSAKYYAEHANTGIPLLTSFWTDHLLNDINFLRADTFSWQSGAFYTAVYNELLSQYNHTDSIEETENGVVFKRTPKGYKICAALQQDNVAAAYEACGSAWYYILDAENQRFKLPRTQHGFTMVRTGPGDYVAPEADINLTHFHVFGANSGNNNGSFVASYDYAYGNNRFSGYRGWNGSGGGGGFAGCDANYGGNMVTTDPVVDGAFGKVKKIQPAATQMYLYFFVGNHEQSALEQTAGLSAEQFNGKADIDLANLAAGIDLVAESYSDGAGNWYRKYKSGWVEQGGIIESFPDVWNINFLKPFANGNYMLQGEQWGIDATGNLGIATQEPTYAQGNHIGASAIKVTWYACGQGE